LAAVNGAALSCQSAYNDSQHTNSVNIHHHHRKQVTTMSHMKNHHYNTTETAVNAVDNAVQVRLDADAIDRGNDAAAITDLTEYGPNQIKEWADDDDALTDAFGYTPLSGEWVGESIPEIFGYWPDDDTLQRYENLAVEQYHANMVQRVRVAHIENVTAELSGYNAHQLAYRADCASPDSPDSHGAQYLTLVRDSIVEAYRYNIEHGNTFDRDDIHDIVDGCVPVYTHNLWETFVDLGAYSVDVDHYSPDIEHYPTVALYVVGENLASSLVGEMGMS
jgi:hypothetical protein